MNEFEIIPEEFAHIVTSFYVGSVEKCASLEEWVAGAAARNGDRRMRDVAVQFLEYVFARNPSTQELQRVWRGAGASYFLPDEVVGPLLRLLLEALKERAAKEDA